VRELVRLCGQLVLAGFHGQTASTDIKRMIREFGFGGVVLFARNIDAPEQVAELVRELQEVGRNGGADLPLLVAVDQEGGRVQRLRSPWTEWPPARALGRMRSEEHARRMGAALAEELRACGIGMNLAPVLDVDTNPKNPVIGDRSLSDDPELVGRLGVALIQGMQDGKLAACAKHFPGHGDTDTDSHLGLPTVDHSRSRLDDVELRPFRKAIEADVSAIMSAHILVRDIDDEWPATLSAAVIGGLLRDKLKYDGLVLTDDLEMKAVDGRWGPAELAVRSIQAGCDVLSICHDHDKQVRALEALVRAIEAEELSFKRVEASVARVRRVKERFLLPYRDPDPRVARQTAGSARFTDLAHAIGLESGLSA
jgi:beta-N-acetylhexosaminidase